MGKREQADPRGKEWMIEVIRSEEMILDRHVRQLEQQNRERKLPGNIRSEQMIRWDEIRDLMKFMEIEPMTEEEKQRQWKGMDELMEQAAARVAEEALQEKKKEEDKMAARTKKGAGSMATGDVMTKEEYRQILTELKADAEKTGDHDSYWMARLMAEMGLRPAEAVCMTKATIFGTGADGKLVIQKAKEGRVAIRIPEDLKADLAKYYEEDFEEYRDKLEDWLVRGSARDAGQTLMKAMKLHGFRTDICNPLAFRRAYLEWHLGSDVLRERIRPET